MRAIRSKDTKPERIVRQIAHNLGYRFRLHRKDLPGKPDIVFPKWRSVIFVHGCFWHQHPDKKCKDSHKPTSNSDYWQAKLSRNQVRDAQHEAALQLKGWRVLVIWECQTKDKKAIEKKLLSFLKH
jgi:DNA mismatch endonuclease (patch repair protein)